MGLGTNRDYKTRDRAAQINLAAHKVLMDRYIAKGFNRDDASSQAFADLMRTPYNKRQNIIDSAQEQNDQN